MKPPKLVRRGTAALTAEDQHAARQSARRVTVQRPGARLVLQHGPRGAIDVPPPAIVSLLKVRHSAVDVHRVAVQNRRVFVPCGRSALARREQMPRFSLCEHRGEAIIIAEPCECQMSDLRGRELRYRNGKPIIRKSFRADLDNRRKSAFVRDAPMRCDPVGLWELRNPAEPSPFSRCSSGNYIVMSFSKFKLCLIVE